MHAVISIKLQASAIRTQPTSRNVTLPVVWRISSASQLEAQLYFRSSVKVVPTFFFPDYQRWPDRQMESGVTLAGAPTMSGRAVLQNHAGDRPQVQALLRSVPAGTPNGQKRTVSIVNGPAFEVDLGDLTSSSAFKFDNHQGSARIDHNFKDRNFFYGRYRY